MQKAVTFMYKIISKYSGKEKPFKDSKKSNKQLSTPAKTCAKPALGET